MTPAKQRRSQEERSEATRSRVLDAAIECLVEDGYAGATTTRIAARAGVSRGAQLHHFPTRAVLLSEAIAHLARERVSDLERQASQLSQRNGMTGNALDLLWKSNFTGPLFLAAFELWVAARTEPDLRAALIPIERTIGQRIVEVARLAFAKDVAERPDFDALLLVALNAMRGIAAVQSYESTVVARERYWKRTRGVLIELFEGAAA